ncbi:MAG TPA: choice-of-anchor V domain-containing protein [Saprospiraceae bacterium]|nr:choice-of-anchor V domain-containing protein [Saprospiraceae bacterium]
MSLNKTQIIAIVIITLIIGLASSGSHPVTGTFGYTGAPGDSACSSCHSGNNSNFDGEVTINGLPATITTGETYTLTVTVSNPNGNASEAGFQMLALTGTNTNAGSMVTSEPFAIVKTVSGNKRYFGHFPAQVFPASNELSFNVDWTAPATAGSNPVIKFYAAAVIANGNGSSNQDKVVFTNQIIPIQSTGSPLSVTLSNIDGVTCNGLSDGNATAVPVGGSTPYNYIWSNGVTTAINTTLPAGLATVTVTDNNGTTATASTNISTPSAIITAASGSVVCESATNGTVSVFVSGGSGSYTYLWSNGNTNSSQSNLPVGTYSVTVTDGNDCDATDFAVVSASPPITFTQTQTNVSCFGGSNGTASVNVSGGTFPITYAWSNGGGGSSKTNLDAGFYQVTITDGALCTEVAEFTITEPSQLVGTITNVSNPSCFGGNNGSATLTISGGTPNYNFLWSNGASGSGASNTQNNLSAGEYQVTITDLFDCQVVKFVTITDPQGINVIVNTINNVSCNGLANGSISVTGNGVGSISYLWSNGSISNAIDGLSPGTYGLTVTDNANGCTQIESYTITQPAILALSVSTVDVSCAGGNDGSVTVTATGGNGGYSYLISGPSTGNGPLFNNLAAGTYGITVTDSKACTSSSTFVINEPSPILISVTENIPASCLGAENGSIAVVASNGLATYQYAWSNNVTGALNDNISAGIYTVTVTDANACTNSASFTVETNTSFTISLDSIRNIDCFNDATGFASVEFNSDYTYLWSNGNTTSALNNVQAGAYSVIATDEEGCESQPLAIEITQAPRIIANTLAEDTLLCTGDTLGQLSLSLDGGTGELTYTWSSGDTSLVLDSLSIGTYTISINDSLGCLETYTYQVSNSPEINTDSVSIQNISCFGQDDGSIIFYPSGGFGTLDLIWSNGSTSDTLTSLNGGNYVVTVTDENNCTVVDTFNIIEPLTLTAVANITDESVAGAKDGAITLDVTGGTEPYTIFWNNGDSTLTIDSLMPALYSYVLLDANDCSTTGWAVVGGGSCTISASYQAVPASCGTSFDGAINLTVEGNVGDYTVELYFQNVEVTYPLDSLYPGVYTVVISDSLGCVALLENIEISSINPAIILDTLIRVNPTSTSSADGALSVQISGGTPPYLYEWTKDLNVIGTDSIISNLRLGLYSVLVTDSVGCTLSINNIILQVVSKTDDDIQNYIKIYPNPVTDILQIDHIANDKINEISLFDFTGKLIYKNASINQQNISLNMSETGIQSQGIYMLKISAGTKTWYKKILVSMY